MLDYAHLAVFRDADRQPFAHQVFLQPHRALLPGLGALPGAACFILGALQSLLQFCGQCAQMRKLPFFETAPYGLNRFIVTLVLDVLHYQCTNNHTGWFVACTIV